MTRPNQYVAVLPYFGELPSTWNLTLQSMGNNTMVDWLLITDQHVPDPPSNVSVTHSSLSSLRGEFSTTLGFDVALQNPYKLVDFKPAFGHLFQQQVQKYKYWGYCDADVIFGDLGPSLREAELTGSDKIFKRAHLSFIRNDDVLRLQYQTPSAALTYRTAFSVPEPMLFDEVGGFYAILEAAGRETFEDDRLFDIWPWSFLPRTRSSRPGAPEVFMYLDGRTYAMDARTGDRREARYIHLQKRKLRADRGDTIDSLGRYRLPQPGEAVVLGPTDLAFISSIDVGGPIRLPGSSLSRRLQWAAEAARRRLDNQLAKRRRRLSIPGSTTHR